ncbi:exocyst complex component SEC3A-like [Camellia sinensis]|uniref:exocyst complex component SEC3A-like n=1 Tax=Camellia sinensis TaxID=4442 RepID=UPI001036BC79|nr:exocyst complex component SEC3A-like [Camellia sinensis]
MWPEASTGASLSANNADTSTVSEVPALVPPGGVASGNKTGLNDDDTNDDDLGILDIDENDSKTGKNSAELAALNESLQELLDGIQELLISMTSQKAFLISMMLRLTNICTVRKRCITKRLFGNK